MNNDFNRQFDAQRIHTNFMRQQSNINDYFKDLTDFDKEMSEKDFMTQSKNLKKQIEKV